MIKLIVAFVASTTLLGAAVQAQPPAPGPTVTPQPPGPPPKEVPPPPSTQYPPPPPHGQPMEPPAGVVSAAPAPAPPQGQWVYTAQYGWVWMPYDQAYSYVNTDARLAYMFVFYPRFGWRWVVSPWMLGLGPVPVWGTLGPAHFAWYRHPYRIAVPYRGRGWERGRMGRVGGHGRR